MSISLKELIGNTDYNKLDKPIQQNLMTLLERINKIRSVWNKPMSVTSGLRTMEHHIEIYKKIAQDKGIPFDESKVPKFSQHLSGGAVDIADSKKELQKWCKDNETILADVGLWCEDFSATNSWVHMQIFPPKSGKRFFLP